MNEKAQVLRGKEAAMVLENEAFKAAMQGLKMAIDEKRNKVSVRDPQGLVIMALWEKIQKEFESILIGMMVNGNYDGQKIEIDKFREESKTRSLLRRVTG